VVKVNGQYPKHPRKFFPELADAARSWLEAEDTALAGVWAAIAVLPGWAAAPRSARELYRLLHAVAVEPGTLGGRRVLMCHALAIAMIETRTGRRYSEGTITTAREWLIGHHVVAAEVGSRWTPGVRSLPTRYDLLPWSEAFSELPLPPPPEAVQFARPQLSDSERAVLWDTVRRLRWARLSDAAARLDAEDEVGTDV
jgi:hypothetical protein